MIDAKSATLERFRPLIGETFDLRVDDTTLALRLAEGVELGHGQREGGAFSLVFVGPTDVGLEQGHYRIVHPSAQIDVFLVPIGPFEGGLGYEAIYN